MKKILNKIIINFSILTFLSGCHTLEHRNIFLINKNMFNKKIETLIIPINKEVKTLSAPINKEVKTLSAPVNKEVKTLSAPVNKEVKTLIIKKKINFESLINFSETQLYSKVGKGYFIKKVGRLKNIQYYFSKCFLDVFLIKRNNSYRVNFLQIRSTILNGPVNKDSCLDEISSKLKKF